MVMNITAHISKLKMLVATFAMATTITSCDSVIYDGEGDCSVKYRIEFEYERNMEFANAFATKVSSVSLYVFDKSGVLVHQASESGAALAADDYAMMLELARMIQTNSILFFSHAEMTSLSLSMSAGS